MFKPLYASTGRANGGTRLLPRKSTMPLTGLFLFLFVVSTVLFSESAATYLITTQ